MNSFFSYKAEGKSECNVELCKLIIEIGKYHLSYLIWEPNNNNIHKLQIWSSTKYISPESIDLLFSDEAIKNKSFKSVHLVVNNGVSTLMPITHYRKGQTEKILNLLFTDIEERTNFEYEIKEWDFVSLFGINKTVYNLLISQFNIDSIIPACAGFFQGHDLSSLVSDSHVVRVFFYPSSMTMMVTNGRSLILLQDYDYQSLDDIAYYLIQSCSQLDLNRDAVLLRLSGAISEDSAMFKELVKLFRNVELELPHANYLMDDSEKSLHYFTPSFLLLQCV